MENYHDAEEELEKLPLGTEVPNYFSHKLAKILVSWTDRNLERRFFRCAKIKVRNSTVIFVKLYFYKM